MAKTKVEKRLEGTFEVAESVELVHGKRRKYKRHSDTEVVQRIRESGEQLRQFYGDEAVDTHGMEDGRTLISQIPAERQLEILEQLFADFYGAKLWGNRAYAQERETVEDGEGLEYDKAQWATVATTPHVVLEYDSLEEAETKKAQLDAMGAIGEVRTEGEGPASVAITGCRISFAFYKKMCEFRKLHETGCRFCGLSVQNETVDKIDPQDQVQALRDALERTKQLGNKRSVIEVLPDGSFLYDKEVSQEARVGMMEVARDQESIHQVAIETRPEYCRAKKVKELLGVLRAEQHLGIYMGLETTDEFISIIIHKKGYSFEQFKKAVKRLEAGLTTEEKKRLHVTAYCVVKPIYITEQEAFADAVKIAEDIDAFGHETDIRVDVKYEPMVVSGASHQDYLYHQKDKKTGERRYKPMSYFTVAELLASLIEKGLEQRAKFGQRDDIDRYTVLPKVPSLEDDSMYSQFDFMVYNAVQRFNTDRDVRQFFVDMKIVVENAEEFGVWEEEFCGTRGTSTLSRLVGQEFLDEQLSVDEVVRQGEQKNIFKVCDAIQYNEELSDSLRTQGSQAETNVRQRVTDLFLEGGISLFSINEFRFIDTGKEHHGETLPVEGMPQEHWGVTTKAAYQFEIIIVDARGLPQNIWVKIPLQYKEVPSKPDYIYA